jgi:diadenosine tetraphosphatase ApaH/serine/threonine PP2A family protein phosphatase
MEWTRGRIDDATRAWLSGLPRTRTEDAISLVHGSPRDPVWEYVTSRPIAQANLAILETSIGLHGHTHVPMAWVEADGRIEAIAPDAGTTVRFGGSRALLNPGSVGQPRDGDPRASWMELDTSAGAATWRRVPYDVETVRSAMRDVGLPAQLGDRLRLGL